jgi:ubiquinone/menaquinone biosynthesis C-methylase UbiE
MGWKEWSGFNDRADGHISERLVELADVQLGSRVLDVAAGLGNVEFMESDASRLNFPHASFDAAVSRWGIIFEPDAEAAAGRIRDFLKPGARMAISSWGEPDQAPSSRFR